MQLKVLVTKKNSWFKMLPNAIFLILFRKYKKSIQEDFLKALPKF